MKQSSFPISSWLRRRPSTATPHMLSKSRVETGLPPFTLAAHKNFYTVLLPVREKVPHLGRMRGCDLALTVEFEPSPSPVPRCGLRSALRAILSRTGRGQVSVVFQFGIIPIEHTAV